MEWISDDSRDRVNAGQFTCTHPAMTGDDLITTVCKRTHNDGNEHTMCAYTFYHLRHTCIVHDLIRMIMESVKRFQRQL